MQKTNVGCGLDNKLAIEFQHEPQNAVRSRMRRPHVEHHFLADIVLRWLQRCVGCRHPGDRIWRFDFADGERHEKLNVTNVTTYAGLGLCWRVNHRAQAQIPPQRTSTREPTEAR